MNAARPPSPPVGNPSEGDLVRVRLDELLSSTDFAAASTEDAWGAQYDAGLAWVGFPEGLGGLAVSPRWQATVDEAVLAAGGSLANHDLNVVALGHACAAVVDHGTPEQRERFLRAMFTTEDIWCQLFSEPGSGSDLAGLATSAVRDGDQWVVNGQKVWTTLAHRARWGLLLARTNPDVPKHKGITCFAMDMHAPGVDVRPLFELTGEAEFNEVYFDDVRLDDALRIGEVDGGWAVATTVLMNERVMASGGAGARGTGSIALAVDAWRTSNDKELSRDELMRHWAAAEALRLTQLRAAEVATGGTPGPEGSVAKLRWAELNQAITSFTMDLLGLDAMVLPEDYEFSRPDRTQAYSGGPHKSFLRARANSIEGGTSEIMRNVIAERVLGLPADRAFRETPWREIPRG